MGVAMGMRGGGMRKAGTEAKYVWKRNEKRINFPLKGLHRLMVKFLQQNRFWYAASGSLWVLGLVRKT